MRPLPAPHTTAVHGCGDGREARREQWHRVERPLEWCHMNDIICMWCLRCPLSAAWACPFNIMCMGWAGTRCSTCLGKLSVQHFMQKASQSTSTNSDQCQHSAAHRICGINPIHMLQEQRPTRQCRNNNTTHPASCEMHSRVSSPCSFSCVFTAIHSSGTGGRGSSMLLIGAVEAVGAGALWVPCFRAATCAAVLAALPASSTPAPL